MKGYISQTECERSVEFKSYSPRHENVKTDTPYALDHTDINEKILSQFINIKDQDIISSQNKEYNPMIQCNPII